jgi:iron complex outermembrane receptor protein
LALILAAGSAAAARADDASNTGDASTSGAATVSEVTVTGSHISSSLQTTPLPVAVVGAEDLKRQGSPTIVQLVKTLPAADSSIGESNRFLGDVAGAATVNLRGFGSARTLVLMNGRRLTTSTAAGVAGGEDINFIPTAAIGRIEILKDGAAATYGSDAIAGVVNFITRSDLEGFEINANYSAIRGSAGDYGISGAWGWRNDRGNILVTTGYRRRSELRTTQRSWAILPNAANPFGGWSGASNPGGYTTGSDGPLLANGSLPAPFSSPINFQDDGCTALGGEIIAGSCRFQYSRYDDLVNNEYHYQTYAEINYDLTDKTRFHGEFFWSRHDVPDERVSPTQSTVDFPSPIQPSGGFTPFGGGLSPYPATGLNQQSRFYIPFANPGLTTLFNTHCGAGASAPYSAVQCADIANSGVITSQTQWRPQAYGGNPLFPDGADHQSRERTAWRISAGLNGTLDVLGGVNWDIALTYMDEYAYVSTPDEGTNRVQLALRGFGGPNCNVVAAVAANTPGQNGCLWFNPFSNGVAKDAVYGMSNPFFNASAVPANTNTQSLFQWMHEYLNVGVDAKILNGDAVLNGKVPGVKLPGGDIDWAAGFQFRENQLRVSPDDIYNIHATPCVDSVDNPFPHQVCTGGTGPFDFVANINAYSVSQDVYAGFGEIKLPITDTLTASGAVRYEYYGGNIGGTTNPKADFKWQAVPWFAIRGSAGTSFRAPPQYSITPGFDRVLTQFVDPTTGAALYRPADTNHNPNLKPETATTYSVGGIIQIGRLLATLDYWRVDFKKELTAETAISVYNTMFPSANPASWQCGNAALLSRFNLASGAGSAVNPLTGTNCHPSNFLGITTNLINGPSVTTDGLDFTLTYRQPDVFGGDLTFGTDLSYMFEYNRGPLVTIDGITIAPAIDRAGKVEQLSSFYSDPRIKATSYLNYSHGPHNARLVLHYIGAMEDVNNALAKVSAYTSVDLIYRVALPWQTDLTFAITNVGDANPPFVRSQYNYDYGIGNPLGRTFDFAVRKHF